MGDGAESAAKRVGSTFAGKYRIVQLLRGGGIANVFLADHVTGRSEPPPFPAVEEGETELRRVVTPRRREIDAARGGPELARAGRAPRLALKVLREKFRDDRKVVQQFERGVAVAAGVAHPNVVRTGGLERLGDGLPYCTMELLIGLDLADTLAYGGRVDVGRAVKIAAAAAAGLSAAHAANVVHLDVKPENIFLVHQADGGELVKMLDFGLAAAAGDAVASRAGTPEYMAPEQLRGAPAAAAMDVYALGVVLHEMLSGHAPTAPRWLAADVPAGLSRVIHKATAHEPGERFGSMEELRRALLEVAGEPASAPGRVGGVRG
ncbi:MAG: serine/threonine-protein kinase [Polyangiaceae bacterium]